MARVHVVKKTLRNGDRYYVYAWRGGPCIHVQDHSRPVIDTELLDKAAMARMEGAGGPTFNLVIDRYRENPEFNRLKPSTQRDYKLWLNRASERFGHAPLGAFSDARMRGKIIEWRDCWAHKPRTADKASNIMAILLGWAVERGMLAVNVAAGIKQLHKVNKSDQVWEERHFRAMVNCPQQLRNALKLAGLTGLRLGDLVKLEWENVGPKAIILITNKRNGRAVIPITPSLAHFLKRMQGDGKTGPVLLNSRGQKWTESGLGTVFQKKKPEGFDRTIHDLRGTYVTWLATKALTDDEIARIVGWTAKRVAAVRARYVNEERVVVSITERLSA